MLRMNEKKKKGGKITEVLPSKIMGWILFFLAMRAEKTTT